ncbi:50S ribosomal protein L16 [Candidatus Micrarchaeota archaeon CG08_land_8_20_14_0_20_49_17]|nr:MAG: hypothetical protein AUJ13_02675 [Candidatus Micrarchaeota archaeon CG1_02_49_24]PIU10264.1 MAG: 50S ribosomal protein L16 [Candidatus Micrarchaeota archaeon CG08_land_8_20_14_0_20_49_17]HII54277.1 50S ribosomal protein L16 [Candidatus Micrarchaeota archaeon]
MGLRPARTCKTLDKQAYTRFSKKKPDKSYIKAMPHINLHVYRMGDKAKKYERQFDLTAEEDLQIRDNSLEAGRQTANKQLEKLIPMQYYFLVRTYPHNVVRENKMITGAGADRLQKGMRQSFGRPTNRAARVVREQIIFSVWANAIHRPIVKEAIRRAKLKMAGRYRLVEREPTPIIG